MDAGGARRAREAVGGRRAGARDREQLGEVLVRRDGRRGVHLGAHLRRPGGVSGGADGRERRAARVGCGVAADHADHARLRERVKLKHLERDAPAVLALARGEYRGRLSQPARSALERERAREIVDV